jgi:hypothetical protein
VGAHDGRREPWEAFGFPSRNIKPIVPPVAPFIPSARNYFHNFRRSLSGPRREGARSKLCNLISNFPFLPVQTIVLGEDFYGRLTAVRSHCPGILLWTFLPPAASPAREPRKSSRCQTPPCGPAVTPLPPNRSGYPRSTDRPTTHSQQMRRKALLRTVDGGARSA